MRWAGPCSATTGTRAVDRRHLLAMLVVQHVRAMVACAFHEDEGARRCNVDGYPPSPPCCGRHVHCRQRFDIFLTHYMALYFPFHLLSGSRQKSAPLRSQSQTHPSKRALMRYLNSSIYPSPISISISIYNNPPHDPPINGKKQAYIGPSFPKPSMNLTSHPSRTSLTAASIPTVPYMYTPGNAFDHRKSEQQPLPYRTNRDDEVKKLCFFTALLGGNHPPKTLF